MPEQQSKPSDGLLFLMTLPVAIFMSVFAAMTAYGLACMLLDRMQHGR